MVRVRISNHSGDSHPMHLHGHHGLVPWIWTAVACNIVSAVLLHLPASRRHVAVLNTACVLAFVGVWIEKGMGLIIPGFVPSTLHELVEYAPTLTEWKITAGIWAAGLMLLTLAVKVALPVLSGQLASHAGETAPPPSSGTGSPVPPDEARQPAA